MLLNRKNNVLYFTTTFQPTEPFGTNGNSGEKMRGDDVLTERKAL